MRPGISWTRRAEDGSKLQVNARRVGGTWQFFWRTARFETWQPMPEPPLEDWEHLLDGVRRRVPRRLFPPDEIDRVLKAMRERFPDAG